MKHFKALILISCFLFILNCKTTSPLQFQENKQIQTALIVVGSKSSTINTENVDINEEQTASINMDEKTSINQQNASVDKSSLIEGIWSNDKNTYQIGIQETDRKGEYLAIILNSQEPTIKQGEILAEFFETEYEHIYSTEYYLEDKKKIVTKSYVGKKGMLLIFLKKWGKENVFFFRNFPIKEATEEKGSDLKQSLDKKNSAVSNEYYIQVGSWKNIKYAKDAYIKFKKHYPDVNLVKQNNFYKVRISGVMSKEQGDTISNNIEGKFNMKSLLVLKTHNTSLADAVRPFIGTSYTKIDCYGLIVRGLINQGVQYYGHGGLREKLENLALLDGLSNNAYFNGEGLVEKAGKKIFSNSIHRISNARDETDKIYSDITPYLQEGLILSFSTTTRGHTGIVSKWEDDWTYINSGVIDNQISSSEVSERVGEEFLKAEIKNWVVLASSKKEPLTVTLGQIDENPLQDFDWLKRTNKLTALNIY